MRLVKIGLGSVNATVGAARSNTDRCIALAHAMAKDDVTVGVFPEQVIGGYAAEDLVQWRGFVASQRRELSRFAEETAGLPIVLAIGLTVGVGGELFNAAALVHRGKVLGFTPKAAFHQLVLHQGVAVVETGCAVARIVVIVVALMLQPHLLHQRAAETLQLGRVNLFGK